MIRSYVKIKPIKDDGAFGANFNEVRKGINRTGSVTENIGNNLVETHKLIQFLAPINYLFFHALKIFGDPPH